MRKWWRALVCFVVIPLATPVLLLPEWPLDWSRELSDGQLFAVLVGLEALAAWLIAYWPKRNGWQALLYAIPAGALAIPGLYAVFIGLLVIECWGHERCLS